MNNILVTSISSKVPFLKVLKDTISELNNDMRIIGSDINEEVVGKYFVDVFWKMDKIIEIDINDFIKSCKQMKIKYIIPTRDEDVMFFSKYNDLLIKKNIYPFVNNFLSTSYCFDKLCFFENGKSSNLIYTSDKLEKINTRTCVVKERYGSGSENIFLDIDINQAKNISQKLINPIFQPFIRGKEYSVDTYITKKGEYIDSIIRSRDLIKNGEAVISTVVEDHLKIKPMIKDFLLKHQIYYHSVLQFIEHENNFFIIECNPRFGGASTLSYKMGLKSFLWFIQEIEGVNIEYMPINKKYKQIRINKDIYFES